MNPRLRVEVGRQANFEYEIPPSEEESAVWLGRGAFCKIRISDPQLSRRHCQFSFENGQLYVEDLESRNGTKLNGELVRGKCPLKHGDHVTVGSHELVVDFPREGRGRVELAELGTHEEEDEAFQQVARLKGTEMAGFALDEIIFNGETSVVFKAEMASKDALAAVKVLKPLEKVTVEDRNRFIRGAKHSAMLRHPNFVRVLKGGKWEGWFFVAMEFVDGRNLEDLVDRKGSPLDVPVALKITDQVLDALEYAYEQELVFRAVRPDNIIVKRDMTVKLTDFDLVKPLSGRQDAQVTRVMDGSLSVDPSYAAPELIAYPVVADQKADIFGAGAVMFYMLCGRAPFGKALPADKTSSAFDRVVPDPCEINEAVPELVASVMQQSMSEYERYGTPQEMRDALKEAAEGAGIEI